jgi:imidazolonepropionase-like amidohydrolase
MGQIGQVVALRAARLFDGQSSGLTAQPMVLIEDGHIRAVESSGVDPPPHAEVLDLGDVTLLPGLIDAHVHLGLGAGLTPVDQMEADSDNELLLRMRLNAQTALLAGITTVRDLGDRNFLGLDLRDWYRAGSEIGPDIVASGPPLTCPRGHCHFMGGAQLGEAALRRAVLEWVDRGVDVIKVMATGGNITPGSDPLAPQFTVPELAAVVEEAHALGRKVTLHSHAAAGIQMAAEAEADGVEHGMFWVKDGVKVDPAVVDRLAENGTWLCPTPGLRAERLPPGGPPPPVAARMASFPAVLDALHRGGVRLAAGSDAGVAAAKPHDVLPWTIQALAAGGLGNLGALRSATSQAAEACDLGDRKGRLAPGYDADIIAVAGDPLADIAALQQIRAVFRAGVRVR